MTDWRETYRKAEEFRNTNPDMPLYDVIQTLGAKNIVYFVEKNRRWRLIDQFHFDHHFGGFKTKKSLLEKMAELGYIVADGTL
jgi:hypothetical protein